MQNDTTGTEVRFPFYARLALVLLSIVLILFMMRQGSVVIVPLFFAVLISFLLLPLCNWLERKHVPRPLAAILSLLLFIAVFSGIIYFLVQQIVDFGSNLPQLSGRINDWVAHVQKWIERNYHVDSSHQMDYVTQHMSGVMATLTTAFQAVAFSLINFVIWTIFVFVFVFFILNHRSLLRRFTIMLFQKKHQPRVEAVMSDTRLLANGYVLGLMTELVIVAFLNSMTLMLFGVKYALLLGVLGAVLNLIPYLGIYTGTALAALITLSNSTPGMALTVIIIFIVVHFLDANIILPRIVGSRVKMNPLATIVVVIIGNIVWGVPGMFLFIPLTAIVKLIFERVDALRPWAMVIGTDSDKPVAPAGEQLPKQETIQES